MPAPDPRHRADPSRETTSSPSITAAAGQLGRCASRLQAVSGSDIVTGMGTAGTYRVSDGSGVEFATGRLDDGGGPGAGAGRPHLSRVAMAGGGRERTAGHRAGPGVTTGRGVHSAGSRGPDPEHRKCTRSGAVDAGRPRASGNVVTPCIPSFATRNSRGASWLPATSVPQTRNRRHRSRTDDLYLTAAAEDAYRAGGDGTSGGASQQRAKDRRQGSVSALRSPRSPASRSPRTARFR